MRNLFFISVSSILLYSCAVRQSRMMTYSSVIHSNEITDYSRLENWAAHPWKKDPSDSIPSFLKSQYHPDSTVDVFFIHPTTLTSAKINDRNAAVNDSAINRKTDYGTILLQSSVFNEYRLFAPRYRQAHLRTYYMTDTILARQTFDVAYEDVRNAFKYYLEHYNNNRPVIIASHSQGTTHALRLLKEFFTSAPLKNKLVVAYLIGMKIPDSLLIDFPMCRDSLQTECLCGWRSFKSGYEPGFIQGEKGSAAVTNPLTWTTTEEHASRELNKGAVFKNYNKRIYHVADARINGQVLWINNIKFPGSFLLRMKNYHVGDINLFYMNIRENVHQRVTAFQSK